MSRSPRIAVVIGTRAQFIKTAPVMRVLQERDIPYWFVFTAQHRETIDAIRTEFGVKPPDYVLAGGRDEAKTIGRFGGWFLRALWALMARRREIIPFRGGIVINHGDTATCLWGTVLARLTGNQAMHLESGLRSFNLLNPFPEEVTRLLTFAMTHVYACPNEWAMHNLRRYHGTKLNTGLNTLYDAVQLALGQDPPNGQPAAREKFAVVSIHRFEHIFQPATFRRILDRVEEISRTIKLVFVAHPSTERQLERLGLRQRLAANPNIAVCGRLPFFEFIRLMMRAEFVVTDGGSNQEELSYLGKPTLLLRAATERPEGLGENAVLSRLDPAAIADFCARYGQFRRPVLKVAQRPSEVIVDWLTAQGFTVPVDPVPLRKTSFWQVASALAVVLLAALYIQRHGEELRSLLVRFDPYYGAWMMLVTLVSIFINGWIMRDLVRQFGVRLRMWEWFGLTAAGSLGNYLPMPQAGAVVRGLYLKREHRLPYDAFTATVLVTYVMMLPAIGILGLLGLAVMALQNGFVSWPLCLLFAGLAASVTLFGPAAGLLRPFKRLARFQEGLAILLRQRILGRMAGLQVTQLVLTAMALSVSCLALGRPIGWEGGLMLGLLANASGIVHVTPGNLGIAEGAAALGAHFLGEDAQLAVVAYSLYRVVSVVLLAVVTLAFGWVWRKHGARRPSAG